MKNKIDKYLTFQTSKKHLWLSLLAIVLMVYGTTFLNKWTYDDLAVVVNNTDNHSFSNFIKNNYPGRPLRELTHLVEYKLFGNQPSGYHIIHLLLHATNGLILLLILRNLGISFIPSLLGSIFFLTHPIQSETVANIGHRKELLAFLFGSLSILFYQNSFNTSEHKKYFSIFIAFVSFIIALTANVSVISIPILFLAFKLFFIRKESQLLLKIFFPISIISTLLICFILYKYLPHIFTYNQLNGIYLKNNLFLDNFTLVPHFMGVLTSFLMYAQKIVAPYNLAPEYIIPLKNSLFQLSSFSGFLLLLTMLYSIIYLHKKNAAIAFGLTWFLVLYAPISNLFPVGYYVADRYMYLPIAGIGIFIAAIIDNNSKKYLLNLTLLSLIILSAMTVRQNLYWRNNFTLWQHALEVNPTSSSVLDSAADFAILSFDLPLALKYAQQSVKTNPRHVKNFFTLAKIEDMLGNYEDAALHYKTFIARGKTMYPESIPFAQNKLEIIVDKLNTSQGVNK